jgi:hypothetical protein
VPGSEDVRDAILSRIERWRELWDAHAIVDVEEAAIAAMGTINGYIGRKYESETAVLLIFAASTYINTGERTQLDALLATIPD